MKKTFTYLIVVAIATIMMQAMYSCSSQEEYQLLETQEVSKVTRGPEVTHDLDDRTVEIIKADMLGALEGFFKGVDYAVDKELSQDEAYGIIIASAISHAVVRSHQAYVQTSYTYISNPIACPNGVEESETMNSSNESGAISLNDQVLYAYTRNDLQFTPLVSNNFDIAYYPNSAYIGKMHNAILPELRIGLTFDFSIPDSNLSQILKEYLESDSYKESIEITYNKPLDFNKYYELVLPMPGSSDFIHFKAISKIRSLLSKIDNTQKLTLASLNQIITEMFDLVDHNTTYSEYDKEALHTAFTTAIYSAEYWTIQHPLK